MIDLLRIHPDSDEKQQEQSYRCQVYNETPEEQAEAGRLLRKKISRLDATNHPRINLHLLVVAFLPPKLTALIITFFFPHKQRFISTNTMVVSLISAMAMAVVVGRTILSHDAANGGTERRCFTGEG